jgi:hypothetical protein
MQTRQIGLEEKGGSEQTCEHLCDGPEDQKRVLSQQQQIEYESHQHEKKWLLR